MIESGLQWLRETAPAVAGIAVVYTPMGGDPIEITAVLGDEFDDNVDGEGGVATHARLVDLLIDSAALVVDDEPYEPQAGDTAAYTDANGDTRTLQVMDRDGNGLWRWSDPLRTRRRINTREVTP